MRRPSDADACGGSRRASSAPLSGRVTSERPRPVARRLAQVYRAEAGRVGTGLAGRAQDRPSTGQASLVRARCGNGLAGPATGRQQSWRRTTPGGQLHQGAPARSTRPPVPATSLGVEPESGSCARRSAQLLSRRSPRHLSDLFGRWPPRRYGRPLGAERALAPLARRPPGDVLLFPARLSLGSLDHLGELGP